MSHAAIQTAKDQVKQTKTWVDGKADEDDWGHGTHAAALILKIAPEADIYVARIAKKHNSRVEPDIVAKVDNIHRKTPARYLPVLRPGTKMGC